MTRLDWGTPGERFYETGIDRGVLYVDNLGVAWNGLISVSERNENGEVTPYYIDGVKYIQTATSEDFAATIEAFSAPREFGLCDGTMEVYPGFLVGQQKRKSFDLSYRTHVGNDLEGIEYGYKLHIVYNLLAGPADRQVSTLTDSPEPTVMTWELTTVPESITGYRSSAHLVFESNKVAPSALSALEDYLYGTDLEPPSIPPPATIIAMFENATA